ncbi:MAG TPA: thioredoxin family protein [Ilumatobacteraceae bacterium]|nr:thioredoxin family protein [Ilumatobacteraceae bacterium]HRB03578.1 thioredoxin family protein [Ilumatobacteraceae bacterium]
MTQRVTQPGAPTLPDGLVVIVKRECATCVMVAPLLGKFATTIYTQDDPRFPEGLNAIHDEDLSISWHYDIETVPTVLKIVDGVEVDRTFGWVSSEWQRITGIDDLGSDLPPFRPGCGSMSVDPDRVDSLRAAFAGHVLKSRRLELADLDDEMELMFERGFTDGLPVVPPTEERVLRMLQGTTRDARDIVAIVPPDLVEVTVEKVAINAVMAGCKPEYLPWVIAALEAVCTDAFNIHGVLATTMPVGPVIVCNGPGTRAIGMNSDGNALGQGNRANLTIGRAVQLIVRNVGGGRPGEVDRATHGNPGKLSFCFAEREYDSPFSSLAVSRGFAPTDNTVTVFAGEGPRCIVDQKVRTAPELATVFAACLRTLHSPKLILAFDAILVVGPEHARVLAEAGWDRDKLLTELHSRLQIPGSELVWGAGGIADGIPTHLRDATLPKFRPDGILLVHAGGGAGLFSAMVGGWANGEMGSQPVTHRVLA